MKRYGPVFLALITILVIFAVAACAKPPTDEMARATDAVTRAQNEPNVGTYAANSLRLAEDALRRMNEAAANKKYDEAKALAIDAANLADRAISEAKDAETQVKLDASNMIATVKSAITEAEQALANARKVKNINLNTNAIVFEIDNAKKLNQDAEAALARAAHKEALDKATNARSSVSSAMGLISEAARESSKKK